MEAIETARLKADENVEKRVTRHAARLERSAIENAIQAEETIICEIQG
jgi:hypothetical protein